MYIYNNVKVYIYMLSMCLCTVHPHWDSIHSLPFHLHPPFSISSPFYPFLPFPFFLFCCLSLDLSTIFAFAPHALVLADAAAATVCVFHAAPHERGF